MIMSCPHSFRLSSRINKFIIMKILSPNTLHMNSMKDSHLVCYFPLKSFHEVYDSHGTFYDRIETWLERFYFDTFPMNYHNDIFNMVNRVYHELIFPTFSRFLFQALSLIFCLEHMFAGLGLLGWLHWHYDFT